MTNNVKIILILVTLAIIGVGAYLLLNQESGEISDTNKSSVASQSLVSENEPYVYEFEADSAEECSSIEEFDEEYGVCYFECDTDEECDKLLAEAEQEVDDYLETYEQESANKTEAKPAAQEEAKTDADYSVATDETITIASGQESDSHKKVWEQIKTISPDSLTSSYIETFRVYSDAEDSTAAYVEDTDENGKWLIAVNLSAHDDSPPQEQILTIVHELAHIVTLNKDQLNAGTCSFETQEGCFGDASVISGFVDKFWSKEDIATTENGGNVYTGNETNFVTEYAATNPGEDIAESFAYYTVKSDYSGSDIASQKQAFFDAFEEQKTIKDQMRKAVLQQFVRARAIQ